MSPISRSPIPAEESTQKQVTTEIPKGNPTSTGGIASASSRSSRRHDALVAKLVACVNVLVKDGTLAHSSLGVFPGVLEGAVLRFQSDVQRRLRARRPVATSSTRRGHFMDTRDRGPSPTREEREQASKETVRARAKARDQEFLNRGA